MSGPVAIIQARMGSTRLPGKVLRDLGGRPVLGWVVRAAQQAEVFDAVVVATTRASEDDPVAETARRLGVAVTRGSELDVLARFLQAADEHGADPVVRLTGDCPLLDPALIRMAVKAFEAGPVDYLSTITPRSLPRGLDVEVLSVEALKRAGQLAQGTDRVHVTSFVYRHPEEFRVAGLSVLPAADDLRVTLDTTEDAFLLDGLVEVLGDRAPAWSEVVATLRARPDLVARNAMVRQKDPSEG